MTQLRFPRVVLVGRYQSGGVAGSIAEIAAFLLERGHQVMLDEETAAAISQSPLPRIDIDQIGDAADLAIAIGGDGTMLGLARRLSGQGVPLVGINHGRLGFITDIPIDAWRDALEAILKGQFTSEQRSMLSATVLRQGQPIWRDIAMNDVVAHRSSRSGMIELEVHVDDTYMYTQRADGLIIATPTGSTAYALSANGPILHPRVAGIVLVPVAPQSLSNRPICLPDDVRIRIRVVECREPRVSCDMQVFEDLKPGDDIQIERSSLSVQFLHPAGYSFFATLRSKLYWHEFPILSRPGPGPGTP
ncbi:MAG: NAD kinase [Burkholderiaceae bacterium]